jgi:uncharacterized protein (DUF2147 family)
MNRFILTLGCLLSAWTLAAQSPVGVWKTIDDETNQAQSHVEIYKQDGKLYGKIVKLYRSDGDTLTCYECDPDDPRYGKPLMGMVILEGLAKDDERTWEDGDIMDPEKGETYDCYIEMESADKLKVRGFISTWLTGSTLGRTQYWYRVKS